MPDEPETFTDPAHAHRACQAEIRGLRRRLDAAEAERDAALDALLAERAAAVRSGWDESTARRRSVARDRPAEWAVPRGRYDGARVGGDVERAGEGGGA